ncbi:MAG: hypothetical protein ACKVOM_04340 [Ferruginibacter sp.]
MKNDTVGNETPGDENVPLKSEEEIELEVLAENDPDDAVHLTPPTATEENKLQDPDDAVHKTVTQHNIGNDLDNQADLDELVHGQ